METSTACASQNAILLLKRVAVAEFLHARALLQLVDAELLPACEEAHKCHAVEQGENKQIEKLHDHHHQ
jgi:hypothetical protein